MIVSVRRSIDNNVVEVLVIILDIPDEVMKFQDMFLT